MNSFTTEISGNTLKAQIWDEGKAEGGMLKMKKKDDGKWYTVKSEYSGDIGLGLDDLGYFAKKGISEEELFKSLKSQRDSHKRASIRNWNAVLKSMIRE